MKTSMIEGAAVSRQCPACGAPAPHLAESVDITRQHAAYAGGNTLTRDALNAAWPLPPGRYQMLRCAACALEFAHPPVAPPGEWYGALYGVADLYPAARWEYGVVLNALQSADTVLDHGCGSGHFLSLAAPRVQRAMGVDFSAAGVAAVQARGIEAHLAPAQADTPLLRRSLSSAPRHVTAFHVLEHLPRPADLFDLARGLGTADVQLWVAVPSDRRASRRHGEVDALDAPPHHLTRWNAASLRALGTGCGWQLRELLYEPLPWRLQVWEAGRRSPVVSTFDTWPTPLRRVFSRIAALLLWTSGRHRMHGASGFSMLARYTLNT
jgi:SAM-dependent methyltransferase